MKSLFPWLLVGLLGLVASLSAPAQTADALINKLVAKGILTTAEAAELQQESRHDFSKALHDKIGMPDWVSALKFNGDFRGRYEAIYGDNPAQVTRERLRLRLRFDIHALLVDDFEVGLRLASGEPVDQFGGSPISGNNTFGDNASKKAVWLGLAYAKWSPLHTEDWSGAFTFGKMEMPLTLPSSLLFCKDYCPEGIAAQFSRKLDEHHTLKLNTGAFVLDELSGSSHDPWLGAAQLRLESAWLPQFSTSLGVMGLWIANKDSLLNENLPNLNRGNTRNAAGAPAYNFNPIHTDATLTYTLDRFPGYAGKFPISICGEYLNNPAAPRQNEGYAAGLTLGKSGKKGQWSLSYRWMSIGADAWFEEFMDVDFAGYYQEQQPYAGAITASNPTGAGFTPSTNARGHIVRAEYSFTDSFVFSLTYFRTELIEASPPGSPSGADRIQFDGLWKF